MTLRGTLLVALAVLVTTFVVLYPYLGGMGFCDSGGCPEVSQSSYAASAGFSATCCPLAVLAAVLAAFAFAAFRGRRTAADHPRLIGLHLSPDPPPPRIYQTA